MSSENSYIFSNKPSQRNIVKLTDLISCQE